MILKFRFEIFVLFCFLKSKYVLLESHCELWILSYKLNQAPLRRRLHPYEITHRTYPPEIIFITIMILD